MWSWFCLRVIKMATCCLFSATATWISTPSNDELISLKFPALNPSIKISPTIWNFFKLLWLTLLWPTFKKLIGYMLAEPAVIFFSPSYFSYKQGFASFCKIMFFSTGINYQQAIQLNRIKKLRCSICDFASSRPPGLLLHWILIC